MSNKQLRIPFNAPLHPQDTEVSTYGCRQNNPDICGNNGLPRIVQAAVLLMEVLRVRMEGVRRHNAD